MDSFLQPMALRLTVIIACLLQLSPCVPLRYDVRKVLVRWMAVAAVSFGTQISEEAADHFSPYALDRAISQLACWVEDAVANAEVRIGDFFEDQFAVEAVVNWTEINSRVKSSRF